jgi:hypothetical protein
MTALENWLAVASEGLSPESVEKVRTEIEEHYGSAVASGASDEEAIAALGDASRANWQYRKVLLTRADVKWLALVKRRGEGRGPLFPLYVISAAGLLGGTANSLQGVPFWALPLLPMTVLHAVLHIPRWVSIDTKLRSYVYRTLRWAAITFVLVLFAKTWSWRPPMLFAYVVFVGVEFRDYLLRRKLPVGEWPKELYL